MIRNLIQKTRKPLVFVLILTILTAYMPVYAINGDTHVIPFVGPSVEKFNNEAARFIDSTPIKLPSKVYKFDLTEAERAFAPNVLSDQLGLWTSPLRMKVRDLTWFLPISGIITALLITDEDFSQVLTNDNRPGETQRDISRAFGHISGYAVSLGLPGLFVLSGLATRNDRLRETGVLQYHGLADSFALGLVLQRIFGRSEPYKPKSSRSQFFVGKNSFPSGHAISAWTLATVIAHQYSHKKWIPITAYTLALVASASRVVGNKHYPSDAFVGALLGYLIGKYVVKKYSKNAEIAEKYRLENSNQ
ncbi:MAG: phosphatase PAP2 family protein [Candidatus Melainabacteria bacterium]|nr:phosphatase PAP2 family protein [Candidatus Melainabacteria bacterium]